VARRSFACAIHLPVDVHTASVLAMRRDGTVKGTVDSSIAWFALAVVNTVRYAHYTRNLACQKHIFIVLVVVPCLPADAGLPKRSTSLCMLALSMSK